MEPAEYETMYRVEDVHWWYRALHRLIRDRMTRHVPDYAGKEILDAGCGTGAILQYLGSSPSHTGIDLSPAAIAFCRQRKLPNVIEGDINQLPFEADTFDAVICSSVLYHLWIPDVEKTLLELSRVLKPGGHLIINVPAFASLKSEHDEKVFTARRFSRSQVINVLHRCRYQTVECNYWTSLLFPIVWFVRRFGLAQHGRDFEEVKAFGFSNILLDRIMTVERGLLRWVRFPAGVSILAIARKPL